MLNETNPSIKAENFFKLPFEPGTRILTENTLNKYSEIRIPKRRYLPIEIRMISFSNNLLTIGIKLDKEPEEQVYIKVTASELLVSCSVDTNESYLSRYAYFTLYRLALYSDKYDFEDYYWPDFFDQQTGESKYLVVHKSKDKIFVSSKVRYKGLYKPGTPLPVLSEDSPTLREVMPIIQEKPPTGSHTVIGFCLADANNERHRSNHYPFLIPYTGTLAKNKTLVKGFKTYVLSEMDLPDIDLTDEQQQLMDICFAMKKIAPVISYESIEDVQVLAEKQEENKQHFNALFELWQQAIPLLAGRLYTHYTYTFGMRHVKGKPSKSYMVPCSFRNERPEICFLWKDQGDYYRLELRLMIGGKIHKLSYYYNTAFFVMLSFDRDYILLSSLMDCELASYFQKNHFKLLILKTHFGGDCKDFVDQLITRYKFIKR